MRQANKRLERAGVIGGGECEGYRAGRSAAGR
jgi:hypothetical protein